MNKLRHTIINPRSGERGPFLNRRFITFIVCFIIASVLWFLHMLSKEYTETLAFPVEYVNIPKGKVVSNKLPDSLYVEVRTTGFSLLPFYFGETPPLIRVDAGLSQHQAGTDYYFIPTNSRIERISQQIGTRFKPLRVQQDTLFFNYSKKVSRLVPVRPRVRVQCAADYRLADSVSVTPASVRISGSEALVNKIEYLQTEVKSLTDVDEPQKIVLKIAPNGEQKQLTIEPENVTGIINVAKFTEGSVQVEVKAKNLPAGYSMQTIPATVKVTFVSAVDDFQAIKPEMFSAVVNYKDIDAGSKKVKVTLSSVPVSVRGVRIEPERVEFILKK